MPDHEVLVFAPFTAPYDGDDWKPSLLAEVVVPTMRMFEDSLEWFWFFGYRQAWSTDPTSLEVDESYRLSRKDADDLGQWVKVRFRAEAPAAVVGEADRLAQSIGCCVRDAPYDLVGDLGANKFIADERVDANDETGSRTRRADKVVACLHAACDLALDALVEVQSPHWRFEINKDRDNPSGSSFQSVVHNICNATDAQTLIHVQANNQVFSLPINF